MTEFLRGAMGEWEWFSIRYTLQKIMPKFKGANLLDVYLETQLFEPHHMYHKTYTYPGNSLGTVQTYSYLQSSHTSVPSLPEDSYVIVRAFSYHFSLFLIIFTAFSLDTQSCALDWSFSSFLSGLFKVKLISMLQLTIYRRKLHKLVHTLLLK